MTNRTCALIITYNRIDLLKECIAAIKKQYIIPNEIVVVNNASTDATQHWLDQQSDLTVLTLTTNEGPAKAFAFGFNYGIKAGFEWIWCMDDDTIPTPGALSALLDFYHKLSEQDQRNIGFLVSEVLWTDNSIYVGNLPWFKKQNESNQILAATFVSSFYKVSSIRTIALPRKEFFQWYVDVEYTWRISERFDCYYVPDSKVIHKTVENVKVKWKNVNNQSFEKYAGGLTNYIYLIKNNVFTFSFYQRFRGFTASILRAYWYTLSNTNNKVKNLGILYYKIKSGLKMRVTDDFSN
ncbi:glycosyltransferase [Mucilaginibacter daejeonensis]|uniref:glycosyltransferase n=1 Tax=Mucilaginibacter daejeonensis TaxID=398049 RepID=UPI001D17C837|nr:glycosyltransferase [Mucilaginibacter daejeonensis]UEG54948.1 glycosyltransferase [Mucilaginibacter daejeonensis]